MEIFDCSPVAEKNVFEVFGIGRRQPNDTFFNAGDRICNTLQRLGIIEELIEDTDGSVENYPCSIPTCKQSFPSIGHFEMHYNLCHRFVCSECKKPLPSPHLLDLHLSELHDSFFKVQTQHKPMFRCFVESCDFVCQMPDMRRKHCIEVHKFPHDFRFDVSFKKSTKTNKNASEVRHCEKSNTDKNPVVKGTFTFGQSTVKTNLFIPRQCNQKISKDKNAKVKQKKDVVTNDDESAVSLTELMDTLPVT